MSTLFNEHRWNESQFGGLVQQSAPAIDLTYLRNYMNDEGATAGESALNIVLDSFPVSSGQLEYTLTQLPNNLYPIFIFVDEVLARQGQDYSINSKTIQFVDSILHDGSTMIARYWITAE